MGMTEPLRDLNHAWRGLKQQPGFLFAALFTLTIGLGANVTVFSMVNGILLRPLPFANRTDRLVTISSAQPLVDDGIGWGDSEISYPDYVDFSAAQSFEGIGGYIERNFVLSGDESSAERVQGGSVT